MLANKFIFGQDVSASIPSDWYIGVLKEKLDSLNFDGDITDKEITDSGYSRIKVPNTSEYFSVLGSSSQMSYATNNYDIEFPSMATDGDITIYGFFLSNSDNEKIAYIWGNLKNSMIIHKNRQVVIRAGALNFSISNTEGSSSVSGGLSVDDNGIMSGGVSVTDTGVLS